MSSPRLCAASSFATSPPMAILCFDRSIPPTDAGSAEGSWKGSISPETSKPRGRNGTGRSPSWRCRQCGKCRGISGALTWISRESPTFPASKSCPRPGCRHPRRLGASGLDFKKLARISLRTDGLAYSFPPRAGQCNRKKASLCASSVARPRLQASAPVGPPNRYDEPPAPPRGLRT